VFELGGGGTAEAHKVFETIVMERNCILYKSLWVVYVIQRGEWGP